MKKSFVIGGVLIFLIIGFLVFLNPFTEKNTPPDNLNLDYNYKEGVHSFSGEIILPNSCYDLVISDRILETDPEQISIFFSTEKNRLFCNKKVKTESFAFTVNAHSNAMINTFFNQEPIGFNLNIKN